MNIEAVGNALLRNAKTQEQYFMVLHLLLLHQIKGRPMRPPRMCENCDSVHPGACSLPQRCVVCHIYHRTLRCPLQRGYRKEIAAERTQWKQIVLADEEESQSVESGFSEATSTTYSTSSASTSSTDASSSEETSSQSSTDTEN